MRGLVAVGTLVALLAVGTTAQGGAQGLDASEGDPVPCADDVEADALERKLTQAKAQVREAGERADRANDALDLTVNRENRAKRRYKHAQKQTAKKKEVWATGRSSTRVAGQIVLGNLKEADEVVKQALELASQDHIKAAKAARELRERESRDEKRCGKRIKSWIQSAMRWKARVKELGRQNKMLKLKLAGVPLKT